MKDKVTTVMTAGNVTVLQQALSHVDIFIRDAIHRVQSLQGSPVESLRGLVITDDEVQQHLATDAMSGYWTEDNPRPSLYTLHKTDTTLALLVERFGLSNLELNILLFCLAPLLDRRYERLYAYLQDDISQKHPTVLLMMNLLGDTADSRYDVWHLLSESMPLRRTGLIRFEADTHVKTFLAGHLLIDQSVIAFLLDDKTRSLRTADAIHFLDVQNPPVFEESAAIQAVFAALPENPLIFMQGRTHDAREMIAAMMCAEHDRPLMKIDTEKLVALSAHNYLTWQSALRDARLHGAALLITIPDRNPEEKALFTPAMLDMVLNYPHPVFFCGRELPDLAGMVRSRRLLRLTMTELQYESRCQSWLNRLDAQDVSPKSVPVEMLARKFRFTSGEIDRVITTALDIAASRGTPVEDEDFYQGARQHSTLNLGHLAQQIIPHHTWDDLILPREPLAQLREMKDRVEYSHLVREQWAFGERILRTRGVKALFAGESGTGKTMSASVLANDLGLVMYRIDLSMVMSKYIGETEKNLRKIFEEAHASNAILFFDEADALFGKRSEVKDARDRYANVETAYLLQQFEEFDGIAILATNLRQNLDDAFTRRLDFLIDFPFPEPEYRVHIWQKHFPSAAPLAKDIDFAHLAQRYELAGGNIRNAAIAAAYLAAADGKVITMQHIRGAVRREQQKMGRLLDDEYDYQWS